MSEATTSETSGAVERALAAEIKLYYDLVAAEPRPAPLLIALHGYGASKWHALREAQAIAPAGFAIASLQGPHQHLREPKAPGGNLRFGFGWLTNFRPEESVAIHHRALLEMIDSLAREAVADQKRIFLLGFSQSCALNYRFAFTHPNVLRGVIGICGGVPKNWEEGPYRQVSAALLHIARNEDEFYPLAVTEKYAERLRLRANDVEFHMMEGAHRFPSKAGPLVEKWIERVVGVTRDRHQSP